MEFFTVEEIATRYGVSEGLICKWAGEGKFRVGVYLNVILGVTECYKGFGSIPPEDLLVLVNKPEGKFSVFIDVEGRKLILPSGHTMMIGLKFLKDLDGIDAELTSSIVVNRANSMIPVSEFLRFKDQQQELIGAHPIPENQDLQAWVTGKKKLCKAFDLKETSITSVYNRVKLATEKLGIKFSYDPDTKEKRLRMSEIIRIKTEI